MKYNKYDWDHLHDLILENLEILPLPDVAKKIGINYNTLLSYCVRNKIKRPIKKQREPEFPMRYKKKLKSLHKEGKSILELSNYFGYSKRSIQKALNDCSFPNEDAKIKASKVQVTEFRKQIGRWLDLCFDEGQIVLDTIKFRHNEVNFEAKCVGHQKCSNIHFINFLRVFSDHCM